MELVRLSNKRQELIKPTKEFLVELSNLYPGIDSWWDDKVVPGITSGERVCYVASEDWVIKAVSIGKLSDDSAKLCTLRVASDSIGEGLGTSVVIPTLEELVNYSCKKIHFTANDEIMYNYRKFFEKLGFKSIGWENNKYINGSSELIYSADSYVIRQAIGEV